MGEGRGLKALNAEGDDLSHLRQISQDKSHSLFTDPIFKSGDGGWEWVQEKDKGICPGP